MVSFFSVLVTLASMSVLCLATTNTDVKLDEIPSHRPSAAVPLPQDLCGFSIEPDRWPDWAGNFSQRNELTYQLLANLQEKTGVSPPIRVGGHTQDLTIYTPSLTGDPGFYDVFPAVPADATTSKELFPEAEYVGAGPNYWWCSCNLPQGTAFTWGVNFGAGNASEAVDEVREIEKVFSDAACSGVELYNIEIGNEADSYGGSQRPENWTISEYKAGQIEYFKAINSALGENGRKYRLGDFAQAWTTEELLNTGIMNSSMGSSINAFSEHHYQSPVGDGAVLANKTNIRINIANYTLSANLSRELGLPFILGETNTYSGHGKISVSNSAAAALWMVDYSLQAASAGIAGLYFHQGVGYSYSAFEPLNNIGSNITDYDPSAKRHVMPLYYGYLVVADAIGNSGNAYVNELSTNRNDLAAYQIWEGDTLKRIMLINETPWTSDQSDETRPIMNIDLSGLSSPSKAVYKNLQFSSLDALSGLTWGGQSWETYSGEPSGHEDLQELGADGVIGMNASSVALVYV